jgi:hypothetical protein
MHKNAPPKYIRQINQVRFKILFKHMIAYLNYLLNKRYPIMPIARFTTLDSRMLTLPCE